MRLYMMCFKMTRIGTVPLFMCPSTILTGIVISDKNIPVNFFRDFSVMFRSLSVLFQHIYPDRQIRAAGKMRDYRPAKFRS